MNDLLRISPLRCKENRCGSYNDGHWKYDGKTSQCLLKGHMLIYNFISGTFKRYFNSINSMTEVWLNRLLGIYRRGTTSLWWDERDVESLESTGDRFVYVTRRDMNFLNS